MKKWQSLTKNLLDQLHDLKEVVLASVRDFEVKLDKYQTEQGIRMLKVRQKVCGCFCTTDGSDTFCLIRGYLSTITKNQHHVMDVLRSALVSETDLPAFISLPG